MDRNVRDPRDRDLDRVDSTERDSGWLWPAVILALVLIGVLVFATSEDDTYTRARFGTESGETGAPTDTNMEADQGAPNLQEEQVPGAPPPGQIQGRQDSSSGPAGQPATQP